MIHLREKIQDATPIFVSAIGACFKWLTETGIDTVIGVLTIISLIYAISYYRIKIKNEKESDEKL